MISWRLCFEEVESFFAVKVFILSNRLRGGLGGILFICVHIFTVSTRLSTLFKSPPHIMFLVTVYVV